jgi:cytoskeletal protein RodZ
MTFLHKSVGDEPSSFGSDLRDLRDLHAISLETACRETRIDRSILEALEADRVEDLDDPIFAERHLLAYVSYLGGYEPYFKARYRTRLKELGKKRETTDLLPRKRNVRFFDLFVAPQFLAFLGVVCLGIGLGGYVVWQAYVVNAPPPLEIEEPADGERLDRPRVVVVGQTIPEATISVNDRDAAVDGEGRFHLELDVPRGTTVISIVARRRRGSETRVERRVTFDREVTDFRGIEESAPTSTGQTGTATSME